jgi:hypothetical protein
MIPLPLWFNIGNLLKVLPYVLVGILVLYGIHLIRVADFERGAASVQKKWDEAELERSKEIIEVKAELFDKQLDHIIETAVISNELINAKKKHDIAVSNLTADYERRLLLSADRAKFYQRQAEGGSAECGSLANHAGKLDTTLEEGRSLVTELRTTLELRDTQIKGLGDQIKNDRELLR